MGKNVYQWHGRTYMVQSLAWLRQLAAKLGMAEQYKFAKDQELAAAIDRAAGRLPLFYECYFSHSLHRICLFS